MATTDDDARTAVLARHVAEAADAWLRDPLDAGIYQRLVAASLAWRAHTRPALEGLEHAGRIEDPPTLGATPPARHPGTQAPRSCAGRRDPGGGVSGMDTPPSPPGPPQPVDPPKQWTVGQLRAELIGLRD